MIQIEFSFDSGRYHATPWGSHVNEGIVEWPPSPWRICRALLATGFAKKGWLEYEIPDTAVELINSLCAQLPSYSLPPATIAHTRHYMPIGGMKTTKVLDTFAHVGNETIVVHWPVTLRESTTTLLRELLSNLGYLGRAESWVSARLLSPGEETSLPETVPCEQDKGTRRGFDQVAVLCPLEADVYQSWRKESYARSEQEEFGEKKATKAARRKLDAAYPLNLLECLLARTSVTRAAGWSQAPGSRKVLYWVRNDTVESTGSQSTSHSARTERHEFAFLALSSDTKSGRTLPRLRRALPQGEILHKALIRKLSDRFGDAGSCPELTGKDDDGRPLVGHQHAHYIPFSLKSDGTIDHIIVYAPGGMGDRAQHALQDLRRTPSKGLDHEIFVTLTGLSDQSGLLLALKKAGVELTPLSCATQWKTMTPFIAPRFTKAKGKNTIEGQIQQELEVRGFPQPTSIRAVCGQTSARSGFLDFVRQRRGDSIKPPSTIPWMVHLEFAEPVCGPILLGYASHYGLGAFMPD